MLKIMGSVKRKQKTEDDMKIRQFVFMKIRQFILWILLTVFYKLEYDEDRGGYYLCKRLWVFIVILPITLIPIILLGIWNYIVWVNTNYAHYIVQPKTKLDASQSLSIKKLLFD